MEISQYWQIKSVEEGVAGTSFQHKHLISSQSCLAWEPTRLHNVYMTIPWQYESVLESVRLRFPESLPCIFTLPN